MWVAMSAAEREEFLAGVHVGVLSAAVGSAGQTLAVPVWYSYHPDELTEAVRRLAAAWRVYRPPAFPVPAPAALTV